MIKVLIADDHAVLRHGLRLILQQDPRLQVVGEAGSGADAVAQAQSLAPDIVLMDVGLPDMSGIEATRRLRAAGAEAQIIMLTISDRNEDLLAAFKAGARGYLLKSLESKDVLAAIHRVTGGEMVLPPHLTMRLLRELAEPTPVIKDLTDRERDVLQQLARGLGNKEIAANLNVSENTVKTHVRHILGKLNLRSRAEAAAYAVQAGFLSPG
jgi:DNA-binding NarL/FixJ family response regulator